MMFWVDVLLLSCSAGIVSDLPSMMEAILTIQLRH